MSEESFKLLYKQQIWHKYSIEVTLQEKKTQARQIFNMAAIFQYAAAMGYPEIIFFVLKGQQMIEKDNDDNKFYVLGIENVQLIL